MTNSGEDRNKISRKSYLTDFLILLVIFCVLFAPYLFTSRVFSKWFDDVLVVTRPNFVFTARCLLNGSLPLWNPYSGYPTHALGCAGTFYPTTVLYGLLPFHNAFKADALLHLYLTALTSYLLGRILTNRRSAGLAVALLVLTSRFLLAPCFGGSIWQLRLLTWFPLAVLTLTKAIDTGRMKWGLGLALILALQVFAGDYQSFVYQLLWLGVAALVCLVIRGLKKQDSMAGLTQRGALCLGAVVLSLAISAVQWLPGRELLSQSIRSHGVTLDYVFTFVGRWSYFLNELFLIGNKGTRENALGVSLAGPFVVGLLMTGALQGRGKGRWMAVLTLVFGLLFTMWPRSPFAEFMLHVPIIGQARFVVRMYNFCLFSAYLLVGFGVRSLMDDRERRKMALPWLIVAIISGTASAILILIGSPAWYLAFATPLILLGALAAILKHPAIRKGAFVLLAAVFLVETFHFQRAAMKFSMPKGYRLHRDYVRFVDQRNDRDRMVIFHPQSPNFRGLSVAGVVTKDRFVGINHTVILENYARLLEELTPVEFIEVAGPERRLKAETYWNLYKEDWISEDATVYLDLFNVRYLLEVQRPLAYPEREIAQGGQRFTKSTVGKMTVYENHLALPVVYAVHKARVTDSLDETIELLKKNEIDVHQEALVESPFSPEVLQPRMQGSADEINLLEYENTRVVVEATLASDGLVVVTDPHYPGWVAYVDDEPAAVHLVNGLVRGVVVPEGEHTVEFIFRSQSFGTGLVISVLSLILAGIFTVFAWRRSQNAGSSSGHDEKGRSD